jgi:hypothetical protein
MRGTKQPAMEAEVFYGEALDRLLECGIPFMVGGAYAMRQYADIVRDTKDLDVFCKAGDYPRLLDVLHSAGYETEITDGTWLAKASHGTHFVDIIFSSANQVCPVDDTWLEHAIDVELLGRTVKLMPPEELIWTKAFVQDRERFDGADILHVIRHFGSRLDWQRILTRMEPTWEILLAHLVNFRFVYPSERDVVPQWLLEDLLARMQSQLPMPTPQDRVCRGRLLSRTQYIPDLEEWGYIAR